jgi:hypothetical protein
MRPKHILFLDDLLRSDSLRARGFVYACIAEPLRQAFDIAAPKGRDFPMDRGLAHGFDPEKFAGLAGQCWHQAYAVLPDQAADYLLSHIPESSLVIGYEMPPWLRTLLDDRQIMRVDIRMSPLRFGRDLAFVFSAPRLNAVGIRSWSGEILRRLRVDAGLMSAAVQHNAPLAQSITPQPRIIYVGQTRADAALLDDNGELVRISQYANELRELVGVRPIAYAPHPYAGSFAREERATLRRLLGRDIALERTGLYSLMAGRSDVEFVALFVRRDSRGSLFRSQGHPILQAHLPYR